LIQTTWELPKNHMRWGLFYAESSFEVDAKLNLTLEYALLRANSIINL